MSTTATELNLETVSYAKKGAIAYLTLNRPKVLNALNERTWEDLKAAFEDAQDDDAVRGVILTGAGDKAFIAGADISELTQVSAVEAEESSAFGQEVLNLVENLGKPVNAAVNGFALGGGCETAMACSIRIAAENAKFGQPEVKLGVIPGGDGTQRCRAHRERSRASAHSFRRDDQRARSLSHRALYRRNCRCDSRPTPPCRCRNLKII
jgi:enoyl-CoA hydratase/carnithine racemase